MNEPILAYHTYIVLVNFITDGCIQTYFTAFAFSLVTLFVKSGFAQQKSLIASTAQNKDFNIPLSHGQLAPNKIITDINYIL